MSSLLCDAVRTGSVKEFIRLLDEGVDVNEVDKYGSTALALAAQRGDLEMCKLLLRLKADPNAGLEPPLTRAYTTPVIALLLDAGADPNSKDDRGFSALHHAAACQSEEAVSLLLTQPIRNPTHKAPL